MLIDSHCHLNFPELSTNIEHYLELMAESDVRYALCVGTRFDNLNTVIAIAEQYKNIYASVGIHPDEDCGDTILTAEYLLELATHPKVVAIGETGLDYYKEHAVTVAEQHERFLLHIEVARSAKLPLIIHTRSSIDDTLNLLRCNAGAEIGAVMHCFTENLANAKQCLDLGYYISLSGIVTFKNAATVQEVAKYVPLDRMLIETDAPFLAPVPFRGKLNHPALVKHTAMYIAELRGIDFLELANVTSQNFARLFSKTTISQIK